MDPQFGRGVVELGELDGSLYSLMVVMAVVTTAMAGPLLTWLHSVGKADSGLLDVVGEQAARPAR